MAATGIIWGFIMRMSNVIREPYLQKEDGISITSQRLPLAVPSSGAAGATGGLKTTGDGQTRHARHSLLPLLPRTERNRRPVTVRQQLLSGQKNSISVTF